MAIHWEIHYSVTSKQGLIVEHLRDGAGRAVKRGDVFTRFIERCKELEDVKRHMPFEFNEYPQLHEIEDKIIAAWPERGVDETREFCEQVIEVRSAVIHRMYAK